MAKIVAVTKENFQSEVLDSKVPVLVDFSANWCPPCRGMIPLLKEMEAESDGKYKIVKVDSDESVDLCAEYEISGLPTFIVFKGGLVADRMVGSQSKKHLLASLGV